MPSSRYCAVAACNNNSQDAKKNGLDISFHRFPKDEKLIKLWIQKCHRLKKFNTKTSVICDNHFRKEDYEPNFQAKLTGIPKKKSLLQTAVPSINLKHKEKPTKADLARNKRKDIRERKKNVDAVERIELAQKPEIFVEEDVYPTLSIPSPEELVEDKYQELLISHECLKRKYENMAHRNRNLEKETNRLSKEVISVMEVAEIEKNTRKSLENILKTVFSHAQVELLTNSNKRVSWSHEDVSKALTIKYLSKPCYIYLRDKLNYPLPHIDSLKEWDTKLACTTGDNEMVIEKEGSFSGPLALAS